MRVVLSCNESIGHECLKVLIDEKQEVLGVVTDKTNGDTRIKTARIKSLAKQAGIKLWEPSDINDPAFLKILRELEPDIIFNIAFVKLYKSALLSIPSLGCVNFHPGPLPKYGGSNGWVWSIIHGEREYGIVFHYMKEKIDTGDIIGIKRFPIEDDDTGLSLLMKCYRHGALLFRRVLSDIVKGTVVPLPQDLSERSYYYNKVPYEGMVDVSWSASKISNFVRAMTFTPFPNPLSPAMIKFKGEILIVREARVLEEPAVGPIKSGEVLDIRKEGVVMQTGIGMVMLRLSDNGMRSVDIHRLCESTGIRRGSIMG